MIKPSNQQIVEVLQGALNHLSTDCFDFRGRYEYICWAMGEFENNKYNSSEVTNYIREAIIYPRIEGSGTLKGWLMLQGIPEDELCHQNGKLMQIHRRQWVEQLIREFSS